MTDTPAQTAEKMALRVYDTRSRAKRDFEPHVPDKVRIYACGITPYSPSHLGHARQAIAFDVITRWLRHSGYDVHYVTNFTDIDDKIIAAANEQGVDFSQVAETNIADYYTVMDAMNVLRADVYPRVSETLPEIIDMVEILIEKGHAYVGNDGVYFDIDSAPEKYGQLTGQTLEMVRAGAGGRVAETGSGKRDHRDFALWKLAKSGEPSWASPWGEGRPGWHIECSAMSLKHLGETFDIHGGGADLLFPHHEAEIFQSECCLGIEPVVKYWLHNGLINVDGEKMSKSLENFWTISDTFEHVDPLSLRYALLNAPYRQPIEFNMAMLEESEKHYERMIAVYGAALVAAGSAAWAGCDTLEAASERFTAGMNDDFNSRTAMVEVQAVVRELRALLDKGTDAELIAAGVGWLDEFAGDILGLLPAEETVRASVAQGEGARSDLASIVEPLLEQRAAARAASDWTRADEIREELNALGVVVEDSPDGPVWRLE